MHDRTRPPVPDGFKFRIIWTTVDTLTGGGRASAKRMTYPVRIPAGLVYRLLHPTICLQFDGTGSVSNNDYDRAETNPVWNRAEPKPVRKQNQLGVVGCRKSRHRLLYNQYDPPSVALHWQPHFEKQRWRNRAGPRMFCVRAVANTTHLTRRRHR